MAVVVGNIVRPPHRPSFTEIYFGVVDLFTRRCSFCDRTLG